MLAAIGSTGTLVAGRTGLDREVRWVHTTDLPDPSPYLRGGELLLTSALWYERSSDTDRFVTAIVDSAVSALAVSLLPGREPPAGLVESCERHGVPLIMLPDIAFRDISEVLMTRIMDERQKVLIEGAPAVKEIQRNLVEGRGVAGLTDVLTREAQAPCWILYADGTAKGSALPSAPAIGALWATAYAHPLPRGGVTESSLPSGERVTLGPVACQSDLQTHGVHNVGATLVFQGSLAALDPQLDGYIRLMDHFLPQIATVQSARGECRTRFAEYVKGLLAGSPSANAHEEAPRYWSDAAGSETVFHDADAAMVVTVAEGGAPNGALIEGAIRSIGLGIECLGGKQAGAAIALLRLGDLELEEVTESVWHRLDEVSDGSVFLGASAGHGASTSLRDLIVQAQAANRQAAAGRGRGWAMMRDVSSHALLLAVADPVTREMLITTALQALLDYDQRHHAQLLHTLRVFLESNGSWSRAAERLQLHVSSLRYRVRRIEELTGRDLSTVAGQADLFLSIEALYRLRPESAQEQLSRNS